MKQSVRPSTTCIWNISTSETTLSPTPYSPFSPKSKRRCRSAGNVRRFRQLVEQPAAQKRHLKKIREQGIEIVKFDPFTFPYINHAAHRDHRKIVVIDGEIAYTGGMNIADYYINGLPKIGTWRDMHMRIEGDAVNDLQEIFLTIWNKETKQNIGGEIYFPQHEDSTNIVVAIVDRTPKKNSRMLSHAYAMSIYSAQKNVHIVNPYFVPTSSIKKRSTGQSTGE